MFLFETSIHKNTCTIKTSKVQGNTRYIKEICGLNINFIHKLILVYRYIN